MKSNPNPLTLGLFGVVIDQWWSIIYVPVNSATFRKLLNAKRYIAQNYNRGFNLNDVAKDVGISKFHLSRNFKGIFGETMYQFHTRIRISKATKWICKEEHEISDVAWKLGFPDLSSFSKFFKKSLNIPPRRFKKYYRKDDAMFLNELFRYASKTVFAISGNAFLSHWESEFGDNLLQAHLRSKAKVTRIFFVESPEDLTSDYIRVIEKQLQAKVEVKLLYLNENAELKKQVVRLGSFALIDDKIAGIRKPTNVQEFDATWCFRTPGILNKLIELKQLFQKSSVELDEKDLSALKARNPVNSPAGY